MILPKKSNKTRLLRLKLPRFGGFKVFPENFEIERDKILDPGGDVVLQWNRVFLFWCLVALYVDPLFFFLSSVKRAGRSSCMTTDLNLGIVVTFFRTLADLFYVLHIVIKFRTAYVSRTSRVFGRGELVKDPKMIARRYLRSDFIVDLIACLPLPQVTYNQILTSSSLRDLFSVISVVSLCLITDCELVYIAINQKLTLRSYHKCSCPHCSCSIHSSPLFDFPSKR